MSSVEFERPRSSARWGSWTEGFESVEWPRVSTRRTLDVDALVSDRTVLDDTSSRGDRIRSCGHIRTNMLATRCDAVFGSLLLPFWGKFGARESHSNC